MNIWFLLWAVLSTALIYFLVWTLVILYRQKKAWRAYATHRKLRYSSRSFFGAPKIDGVIDGYTVSLFTGEHQAPEARGTRKLTAIEVNLSSVMPFDGAIASGGMMDIVTEMGFYDEVKPDIENWDSDQFIVRSDQKAAMAAYLTQERLKSLIALMKQKNAWTIVAFRNGISLLRLDTPLPLDDMEKIDRILKRMLQMAKLLELTAGESGKLKAAVLKTSAAEASLTLDDDMDHGFQLEDDET